MNVAVGTYGSNYRGRHVISITFDIKCITSVEHFGIICSLLLNLCIKNRVWTAVRYVIFKAEEVERKSAFLSKEKVCLNG